MNNITKIDNLEIIRKDEKIICRKKINYNIIDKYKYLKSKDFKNIIDFKIINGYIVRDYIDEVDITKDDKINELIYVISMLHIKTTHYKNMSLTDVKLFYEKTTDEIIEVKKYYNDLCEKNDIFLFLKPSMSLLIKNISLILISLDNSKYFLDKWYDIAKNKLRKRVVMNHNNLKLSNFIVGDYPFLINFNKSIIDYPIYDIISIFKNNYDNIDMTDIFNVYNSKYSLYPEEKYLLYSMLLKIDKLNFDSIEIVNTRKLSNLIKYLDSIFEFLKNNIETEK